MRRVRILSAAELEAAEAAEWYESRCRGLGVDFIAAVDTAIDRLALNPDAYPIWRDGRAFRRLVLDRFPFVVFFRVLGEEVEVVAIAHAKRRPGYWVGRS